MIGKCVKNKKQKQNMTSASTAAFITHLHHFVQNANLKGLTENTNRLGDPKMLGLFEMSVTKIFGTLKNQKQCAMCRATFDISIL